MRHNLRKELRLTCNRPSIYYLVFASPSIIIYHSQHLDSRKYQIIISNLAGKVQSRKGNPKNGRRQDIFNVVIDETQRSDQVIAENPQGWAKPDRGILP